MLKFALKAALFGSAVYYTVEKGVWKDCASTSALYEELEAGVSPYVGEFKKQIPYDLPPLPSNDRVQYLFKYYWNQGVKSTFKHLVEVPTHVNNASDQLVNYIKNLSNVYSPLSEETPEKSN